MPTLPGPMLISIIVPSFNQNQFIERTLDSILGQDYRPIEIIICDGASTDGTVETLRRYASLHAELRWISEPDKGPADAVNKGLAMALGEIAAIQSSDDIYYPGAFETVAEIFQREADCGFIIGDYCGINDRDEVLYTETIPAFSWEAYFARSLCIPQSSIFFRTALGRELNGWNAKYYSCDLDFWLRMLLRTRALHAGRVLSGWRLYKGQRTHAEGANAGIWNGYWQMMEDSEDLRAASPRIRRLASASRHLLALRHHPTSNPWIVRGHLLLGLLQYPTFWARYPWELSRWVPGVVRARRLYSRWRGLI